MCIKKINTAIASTTASLIFEPNQNLLLKLTHQNKKIEAGCDEAGRGCLAGPVFAAAVILPPDFYHPLLNDSKQVDEPTRKELRKYIRKHALAYSVAAVDHEEIDKINILKASFKAMHLALDKLKKRPKFLLIDGNRFIPYKRTPHACIIKGDATYASIAAASILAKTYRDDFMRNLHKTYPHYNWRSNKGYATPDHRKAIEAHGLSPFHRRTFYTCAHQLQLELELDELGPEYHFMASNYELAQSPEVYNLILPTNEIAASN